MPKDIDIAFNDFLQSLWEAGETPMDIKVVITPSMAKAMLGAECLTDTNIEYHSDFGDIKFLVRAKIDA